MNHDYETFSPADLPNCGAWNYAKHPLTEALCLAYKMEGRDVQLWRHGEPIPQVLVDLANNPTEEVKAFNWSFEYVINTFVIGLNFPVSSYNCTASLARSYGIGISLDTVTNALPLGIRKDNEGYKVMMQTCKPKAISKAHPYPRYTRANAPDKFAKLDSYCITDTLAEKAVEDYLPPWNPFERAIFEADKTINLRGVPIDRNLAECALDFFELAKRKYNEVCKALCGVGYTQPAKILEWMAKKGVRANDLTADTVRDLLFTDLPEDVRQVLEIRQMLSKTSIAKYSKMLELADSEDDRIRFIFLYFGALTTGRWAGRGIQPHNFPRGNLKHPKGISFDDFIESIYNDFETLQFDEVEAKYGNIPDLLSSLLRATIKAPEGMEFYTSDFSNIEGRVLFWVSKCLAGLTVFYSGKDIYIEMASDIYGIPYDDIAKGHEAGDAVAKNQRQMGKQAILGLGYMMGAATFLNTLDGYNIAFDPFLADWTTIKGQSVRQFKLEHRARFDRGLANVLNGTAEVFVYGAIKVYLMDSNTLLVVELPNIEALVYGSDNGYKIENLTALYVLADIEKAYAQDIVNKYRNKFDATKQFWYACERAAVNTLETGQPTVVNEYLTYYMWGDWLMCQLPSGRPICYYQPQLRDGVTPWGAPTKKISYMGLDSITNKWCRIETYSGKLVENIVQAISRDLLADAILRCEANDYPVVMHVHDEIVSLKPHGTGDIEQFNALLSTMPTWANGLPMAAAGWHGVRYRKD